jgi:hypothetical protein
MQRRPRRSARGEHGDLDRERDPQEPRAAKAQFEQRTEPPSEERGRRRQDEDCGKQEHMVRIGASKQILKFRRTDPIYQTTPSQHAGGPSPQGVTMKAYAYRIFSSATAISVLALVLGAPKKWG